LRRLREILEHPVDSLLYSDLTWRLRWGRRAWRVDAGGHDLSMVVAGQGTPAVVLESGLSDTMNVWARVLPRTAALSRVVAYERAGVGASDAGPEPRTALRIAAELHASLGSAAVAPPYVLVGFSFGGILVRAFAHLYPEEVSGLVFVDPSHEDFYDRLRRQHPGKVEEILRSKADWSEGSVRELAAWDESEAQASALGPLPDVPVALVTGVRLAPGVEPEILELWRRTHAEWMRRVPGSLHIVSVKSGHSVPIEDPDSVVDAIRHVLSTKDHEKTRMDC
jgi:pimeloyl-ACP methyl ester carboxylesterase